MHILVQPGQAARLRDAGDFKSFCVRLAPGADTHALADALRGIAELQSDGHAWIDTEWLVLQLADAHANEAAWRPGFDAMLRYAARQGWIRGTPARVRAHIETA